MTNKELYTIREWAPLTDLIEKIPARMTRTPLAIFMADLNITCVDAIAEFIALGSDAGIVFWYDRYSGELQKLRTEFPSRITCVKIVNSVEYMVAAGNASGQVSVFQIQKQLPPDLDLVAPCTRAKPIERYTIRDLHNCAVSCVEWSKNGMKLYSGDRQGIVVLTEFDFQAHLSKSAEILSETYEIVQLNVCQSYLLVSTLYRSVVCQRNATTGQWQVTQVGKKDRKVLTDCGGVFIKQEQSAQPLLVCGRPGLRFWIANTEGNVEKTLLFREAVARSPTWEIPILNPKTIQQQQQRSTTISLDMNDDTDFSRNFGVLHLYAGQDRIIVTHDESTLYVLNLDRLRVEAVARGFRKILNFCVCGKEIFILEGTRSLLRLAPMPEKPSKTAKIIFNPTMPPPVPLLGATIAGAFESPVELYEPAEQPPPPLSRAEECFELPPIEALNLNVPIELAVESPRAEQNRRLEIFQQISEMDFDQSILHHSGISRGYRKAKRTRRSREREQFNESNGSSNVSDGDGGGGDIAVTPTKSQGIVEIGRIVVAETDADVLAAGKAVQAVEVMEEKSKVDTKTKTKATTTMTKPTLMESSFCVATAVETGLENERKFDNTKSTLNGKASKTVPILAAPPSPTISQPPPPQAATRNHNYSAFPTKPKTLAEELNLAGISFGAKQCSLDSPSSSAAPSPSSWAAPSTSSSSPHNAYPTAPATTPTPIPTPLSNINLAQAYPKPTNDTLKVEDAGVQTTARKKVYYNEEVGEEQHTVDGVHHYHNQHHHHHHHHHHELTAAGLSSSLCTADFSAGEPIDGLCNAIFHAANTSEHNEREQVGSTTTTTITTATNAARSPTLPLNLRFINTQPLHEEETIASFLPDFRRAADPWAAPPSAESNGSSSEWEFLDN